MEIFDDNVKLRTREMIPDVIPEPNVAMKAYARLYQCGDRISEEPVEVGIERMQQHGITKCILRAGSSEQHKYLYDLTRKYPNFFYVFAGIHTQKKATEAYQDLKRAFDEYGFYGVSLGPMFSGVYINDPRNYPLFALADDYKKIMIAHCALHYNPELPYDLGDPVYLDRVAVDFPSLKIILGHAGMGFGTSGMSVAHRHKNVYLDFSALAPEVLRPELMMAANTFLRKKCLFGTSYPLVDFDAIERWKSIIGESSQKLFFHDNTARLLGLID